MKTTWSRGQKHKAGGEMARGRSTLRHSPSSIGESPLADGWNTKTQKNAGYVYYDVWTYSPYYNINTNIIFCIKIKYYKFACVLNNFVGNRLREKLSVLQCSY